MHNNNDDQDCIRIIIADDHTIFRDGLKRLLETEPTFQVVGQAGDGHEAVQLALQVKADVLLLDVAMPKVPGLETLRELNRNQIKIRTLLLTASIERSEILQALQLGAWGVVLKESPPETPENIGSDATPFPPGPAPLKETMASPRANWKLFPRFAPEKVTKT